MVKTLKDESQDTKKYNVTRKVKIKLVELKNTPKENNFRNKSDVRSSKKWKKTLQKFIRHQRTGLRRLSQIGWRRSTR